jgi:hypothetical protein
LGVAEGWGARLGSVNFVCRGCGRKWEGEASRIEDDPACYYHPFRYFAECPECGAETKQAAWERALLKAHVSATGPRTEQGKRRTAENLKGHPTPEEARNTRFNGLKHGLYARTAKYFPARPGAYPLCERCEFRGNICPDETDACLKRTEIFMRHHMAFEDGNPALLARFNADLQASVRAIIDDLILAITQDGVRLKTPSWYFDRDGAFHLASYADESGQQKIIEEIKAHPLLKVLVEMLSRNNMSLADQGMTARAQDGKEILEGYLESDQENKENLLDYERRKTESLEALQAMIERSRKALERDLVLLEHNEGDEK